MNMNSDTAFVAFVAILALYLSFCSWSTDQVRMECYKAAAVNPKIECGAIQ